MHQAASTGHLQFMKLLLLKDVEVDSRDIVSTYNNVMYCVIIIMQSGCGIVPYMIKHSTGNFRFSSTIFIIHYVGELLQFPTTAHFVC